MILIVEDDDDVRDLLELALRGRGYEVETVTSGPAALDTLARKRPCLIVLDMVMPEMTGHDVMNEMRARNFGDVPVCLISALSDQTSGYAVASLTKPFDMTTLVDIAARYCAHHPAG